jgi:hypothetical protein
MFCIRARLKSLRENGKRNRRSPALRSGRDDKFFAGNGLKTGQTEGFLWSQRVVIPTGAKRSGGTCGFSSSSHADSKAPDVFSRPCERRGSLCKLGAGRIQDVNGSIV